jgi:glycolate oxidase FAD binding subunit
LRAFIRFESIETAVEQQAEEAFRLARNNSSRIAGGEDEAALWSQHARRPWDGDGAVVKMSVLPTELPGMLRRLSQSSHSIEVSGRAGLSVFLTRIGGGVEAQAGLISGLRDTLQIGRGSAVIVRGSPELKSLIDVWGPIGDGLPLMRAVQQQFDPAGTLNPGRGPGGI